jgi:hypothetical protein
MFTTDTLIDTIQTAKKEAVKTFVKNEAIANQLNAFVDAQAAYTKDAVKVGTETAAKVGEELIKATKEAAEKMAKGEFVKKYADKASQDFYSTFWNEAFKHYYANLGTKAKV